MDLEEYHHDGKTTEIEEMASENSDEEIMALLNKVLLPSTGKVV